ncbi:MATE family efflux transporter [Sneathiella limimaris]|uniref:MATE family efflux transporter n=1 Tax=Sneathiella limimaris TaxID=1964213 RepID=UPI00146A7B50|nr:MATE family efflux transporter [Sneathiella limimaris]
MTDPTSFPEKNAYLTASLPSLFLKTAAPIILVTFTNGLYTVVDGWFIGRYVGPDALSAVTMVFPLFMMIIALGTLVSSGFASVFSRYFGAGKKELGEQSMLSALLLSFFICLILILLYQAWGFQLVQAIANGIDPLAEMGDIYLSLTIAYSPLFFLVALLSDSLRCQGKVGMMALISILANVFNITCNYILIVGLDMGVAGSAYGTALAQGGASLICLIYFYTRKDTARFRFTGFKNLTLNWGQFLALGAPISLTYVGVSIITGANIYQIQQWHTGEYEVSVAAYGIVTRLLTFGYMPLLGLTLAQQAIVGNNYGAGLWDRTYSCLRLTVTIAFVYCATLQILFMVFPSEIAGIFVQDPAVIAETNRILSLFAILYVLFGPLLMFPGFFQAIGDAPKAATLSLTKIYLISLPMIMGLPHLMGEVGIWYAAPVTEAAALIVTLIVVSRVVRHQQGLRGWMQARSSST